MSNISKMEKDKLKSQGILPQKQDGYFSFRILSKAGNFTSKEMILLSNIAEQYGKGYLGLTSRLTIEIPYIQYKDIEIVKKEITDNNLIVGGAGNTVRAITACKGTTCTHGLIDTQNLAMEIHNKFFGRHLPGKFKIAVVGCSNSYGKVLVNDIGILPLANIDINDNECILCEKCTKVCPASALTKENKKINYNKDKCIHCERCVKACQFHAISTSSDSFKIFIGGKLGKKFHSAKSLNKIFNKEELIPMIEKILDFYNENGQPSERFADTIERIGFKEVEKSLL